MTTTAKRTKTRNSTAADVDAFLAFQTRVQSLGFAKRETQRCRGDAEEILMLMASPDRAAGNNEIVRHCMFFEHVRIATPAADGVPPKGSKGSGQQPEQ